jgi:ubiquinone/menaquinone biosynthesis C-methylase UbiE
MIQKDYWDSVADTKQFTTPFQLHTFSNYVSNSDHILDVGCGYGRTLDELYQNGYQNLSGIDFSDSMIQRGISQFPYLDLQVKKSTTIDFPDSSMDAIILLAVLTCIKSNIEQRQLISEIRRVLKPEGILYVNDFLLNTDVRNVTRYKNNEKKYGTYGIFELSEGAICRHHSEEWIEELLSDFSILCYEHITFTTMNGHTSNGFYYIGKSRVL